jgi:FG-GAP-like repeat
VVATIDDSNGNVIDIYQVLAPAAMQKDEPVQPITMGPNVSPIVAADLNDDGNSDLIVGFFGCISPKTSGGLAVLLSNGEGSFSTPTTIQTPNVGIHALSLVDVNHDGKLDIEALEQSHWLNDESADGFSPRTQESGSAHKLLFVGRREAGPVT